MAYKIQRWQLTLLLILCLGIGWLSHGLQSPALADPRLESRINRLESDLGRLSSQVSRLASQLSSPQRSPQRPEFSPRPLATEPSLAEQFDNLATLAVETKLQVRQLEDRVMRLEQALTQLP
jgi:hypothetical protein